MYGHVCICLRTPLAPADPSATKDHPEPLVGLGQPRRDPLPFIMRHVQVGTRSFLRHTTGRALRTRLAMSAIYLLTIVDSNVLTMGNISPPRCVYLFSGLNSTSYSHRGPPQSSSIRAGTVIKGDKVVSMHWPTDKSLLEIEAEGQAPEPPVC